MRRGPVILSSAVIALVAAVLGIVAWRADVAPPAVASSATTASITSIRVASLPAAEAPSSTTTRADTIVAAQPVPVSTAPSAAETGEPAGPPATTSAAGRTPATDAVEASDAVDGADGADGADDADATGDGGSVDGPGDQCPGTAHGAIVDRDSQHAWLCGDGAIVAAMPITTAWSMPDPGTYPVYAKDLQATSGFGGHFSRMTHFVAFTHGKRTGARIAFHSVPTLADGSFVQALASVGDPGERGESSGCIRVTPDDATRIWDWLAVGDEVHVIS